MVVNNDEDGTIFDEPATMMDEPVLLTAREACRICGTSLRTWRSWHISGKIPRPVRIGRMLFWRREELLAWIEAGCPRRREWDVRLSQKALELLGTPGTL